LVLTLEKRVASLEGKSGGSAPAPKAAAAPAPAADDDDDVDLFGSSDEEEDADAARVSRLNRLKFFCQDKLKTQLLVIAIKYTMKVNWKKNSFGLCALIAYKLNRRLKYSTRLRRRMKNQISQK
jgi:hypothetical protein